MVWPGRGPTQAGAGRLSWSGALRHLFVLSHGDASVTSIVYRPLSVHRDRSTPAGFGEDRHLHTGRLCWHAFAASNPEEQDPASAIVYSARVPGLTRPAADLCGSRDVDRGGGQE